ncbi:MAG: hydroxyacylglutathione hydrolase [Pseudohongiellaceae bacterium]
MIKDIFPIPAFTDNYIWAFHDHDSRSACVVDPGAAQPVLDYLQSAGLELTHVLITHHHADHTGGLAELARQFNLTVYGPTNCAVKEITQRLDDGDRIEVFGVGFQVLAIPGHTLDHIGYFAASPGDQPNPLVFCGDTLFAAGCGRIFEGNPAMMYSSLQRLAHLDGNTRIYCTHEYTLANLKFASAVQPANSNVMNRVKQEAAKRNNSQPTLPSTLAMELATNPFLRCSDPELACIAEQKAGQSLASPVDVFATLRTWKDNF